MMNDSEIRSWLFDNEVNGDVIEKLGIEVRDAYITRRALFYPAYKMDGKTFNNANVWKTLAIRLMERNIVPQNYITAQFEMNESGIPPPLAITGDAGIALYEKWISSESKSEPEATQLLIISSNAYRSRMKQYPEKSERDLLLDETCQADSLFKWCRLKQLGLHSEAERFYKLARLQAASPAVKKVYSNLFGAVLSEL